MKIFFTAGWLLTASITIYAQQKIKDSAAAASYWLAGINYQNNNVYLGRRDSLKLPYLTPSIGYYHKSGLYITTSLSYLSAAANHRIDLVVIEGGYHYINNDFQAQVSGIKYFYNRQSTSVKSEVKGGLDVYTAYNFGFIKPSLEATVNFSNTSDITLTPGIEHTFYVFDNKLDITPSVFLNAGTQNYYSSYYNKRRFAALQKKRRLAGINYSDISAQVTDASTLKLLDYEFDLPVYYTYKKISFSFTPSYAIPVHPAILSVTVKNAAGTQYTTTYPEKLTNIFYYSFGVSYTW